MSKPNNIPAFPTPGLRYEEDFNGMSLRDYFAAKAMQALEVPCDYMSHIETKRSYTQWAEKAYRMADAMLAERAK